MNVNENTDSIRHAGVVVSVNRQEGTVTVKTGDAAECASCAAASMCVKISPNTNTLTVKVQDADSYRPGDRVTLVGTELMHRKAIMLATVIPCIILIGGMAGVYALCHHQGIAALAGLVAMLLFFLGLYLMRNRIRHEFVFTVRREGAGDLGHI